MSHPTARAWRRWRPMSSCSLVHALSVLASIVPDPVAASPTYDAARAANERVGERLERVRNPDIDPPRVDINLRLDRSEDERRVEEWNGLTPQPADDRFEQTAPAHQPALQRELHLLTNGLTNDAEGYWSRGSITLVPNGRTGQDELSLTGGFDGSVRGGRIGGFAASFNARGFGDANAGLVGMLAYGSLPIGSSAFLDLTSGATASSNGAQSGTLTYATARFGFEHRFSGWLVNPYGRAEAYAMSEERQASPSSLVTGLRIERRIDLSGVRLRPQLRWEAERHRVPGSTGVTHTQTLTPAVLVDIAPDWTARIEYRDRTGNMERDRHLAVRLSGNW